MYALYEHYGFERGDIGRLFIAGFGSSMIFGTIVGGLADRHGRRRAALTYVAAYTIGCFTKHFNSFWVLFCGRVFCGIATSLLYSAFESWLVAEHFKRGFSGDWLGGTFSQAVFLGNGLMAILAGLTAHTLVETVQLGPVAPFDAASVVLLVGGFIVFTTWTENYGDASEHSSPLDGFTKAAKLIATEPKIALLGAMQALFEGSMYTFVFLWTPALSPGGEHIPHGMVFACFMVSSMVGSAIAGRLLSNNSKIKVEKYMQVVFGLASLCLFVPVLYHGSDDDESADAAGGVLGISWDGKVQLVAFCAFEALVGVFWPSMMTMRSAYVPEEMRSTIINFFRIPLNLFVCVVLYNVSDVRGWGERGGWVGGWVGGVDRIESSTLFVFACHMAAMSRRLCSDATSGLCASPGWCFGRGSRVHCGLLLDGCRAGLRGGVPADAWDGQGEGNAPGTPAHSATANQSAALRGVSMRDCFRTTSRAYLWGWILCHPFLFLDLVN